MKLSRGILICLGALPLLMPLNMRAGGPAAIPEDPFTTPELLVRGLYASVTFDPGTIPDWDYVRRFFLPEAVIAVRQTRTSMAVLDVDAFIAWFEADVEKYKMKERGFEESVEKLKLTEFGDMAHCFVVYKARFKTPQYQPVQLVLDSFVLMKKEWIWWIVSITNDVVSPNRSLPEALR